MNRMNEMATDKYLFIHVYDYSVTDSALLQKHERLHAMHADLLATADDTGPKKMYWTQPIPNADPFNTPVSDPSQEKRAKLRAKRKNRG